MAAGRPMIRTRPAGADRFIFPSRGLFYDRTRKIWKLRVDLISTREDG
jgi:hypothetical protein